MCSKKGFFTIGAWQKADDLAVKVYEVTDLQKGYFPRHQLYSLTQQFQKAAVSVAANIAEGSGRESLAEYIHFLSIAKGSLTEVEYYIHLANRNTSGMFHFLEKNYFTILTASLRSKGVLRGSRVGAERAEKKEE
jgi:four helix bundle protein